MKDFVVFYTPSSYEFGSGTLTYIGDDNQKNLINCRVEYYNETNKEYGESGGQINAGGSIKLGGGGSSLFSGRFKSQPTFQDIKRWYVVIKWDGKEEKMDLRIGK